MKRIGLARHIAWLAVGALVFGLPPASRAAAGRAGAAGFMTGAQFTYTAQPGDSL